VKAETVKVCIAVAVLLSPLIGGMVWLQQFRSSYGEAEEVVDQLQAVLRADVVDISADGVIQESQEDFLARLRKPEYAIYRLHEMYVDIPLKDGEFIWFKVNEEYNVGIGTDCRILWMVDGNRGDE